MNLKVQFRHQSSKVKAMKSQMLVFILTATMLICPAAAQLSIAQQSAYKVNLKSCYEAAEQNYPLVRQFALIEKTGEYSVDNAGKGLLPQIFIAGHATYQSAVTQVPITLPGDMRIIDISKDQYRLFGEVNQSITEFFTSGDKEALAKANSQTEGKKVESELYKLRDRINQLYFGILLLDAQAEQNEILMRDLSSGISKATVAEMNGVATKSNIDLLGAELLKARQRTVELRALRQSYADILSIFTGMNIGDSTTFEVPIPPAVSDEIKRPELKLYESRKNALEIESKVVKDLTLPKFSLFVQAGIGRPALNMLSNDFEGYYIGGLRLSWNLSSFYTNSNERQILKLSSRTIDVQRDEFLFNTKLGLKQQSSEISKLTELIQSDGEIIALRESVKNTAAVQLEYGTVTAIDFLSFVNAEDQARQSRILHEIQLLMAQYNYKTISGN